MEFFNVLAGSATHVLLRGGARSGKNVLDHPRVNLL